MVDYFFRRPYQRQVELQQLPEPHVNDQHQQVEHNLKRSMPMPSEDGSDHEDPVFKRQRNLSCALRPDVHNSCVRNPIDISYCSSRKLLSARVRLFAKLSVLLFTLIIEQKLYTRPKLYCST